MKFATRLLALLIAVPLIAAPPAWAQTMIPAAASQPSFVPGKSGEPFTVEALLQGCGASDEFNGCSFYAEGVRWVVGSDAGSNEAALATMAALPVNTPLIITGDQISMGDITVEASVAKIDPGNVDAYAQQRADMQGKWLSQDDAQSTLELIGSEETESYQGQTVATSVVTFADSCPGGEPTGPVIYKQQMGGDPGELTCFALVEVTATRMELSYVGRGNTLVYIRS